MHGHLGTHKQKVTLAYRGAQGYKSHRYKEAPGHNGLHRHRTQWHNGSPGHRLTEGNLGTRLTHRITWTQDDTRGCAYRGEGRGHMKKGDHIDRGDKWTHGTT